MDSMPSRSLEERFPPGAIVRVPVDGGLEAFLEIVERFPVQLALGKGRVDGVTAAVIEVAKLLRYWRKYTSTTPMPLASPLPRT